MEYLSQSPTYSYWHKNLQLWKEHGMVEDSQDLESGVSVWTP